MAEPQDESTPVELFDDSGRPKDDEQLNREQIERTGEPVRDALGNAEGAS